jgi:putative nucleotidyltransferase with HDIG domain
METIRLFIRRILIRTARDLRSYRDKGPILRNTKRILSKEVKIPLVLSTTLSSIIVFFMIFLSLGLYYRTSIAVLILMGAMIFAFTIEIRKDKEISKDNDAVVLMCLVLIIGILTLQISQEYISVLVFPISAFVTMIVMLINARIAILYAIVLSVLAGLFNNLNFEIFLILFFSGSVALPLAKQVRSRGDLVTIGLKVVLVNIGIISMFYLLGEFSFIEYEHNIYYSLLNALFSIIVLLVVMPIFERTFSRTTNIKLIELSDFNNPLLKSLMLEAPGTYHHSIMLAAIAEKAAVAINENSILARISAYYHDIGKIKNPKYFVENQSGQNPHKYLTPAMSALILASHVKDGVALARQYNLDNSIIDAIEQHHGTTLMSYFYYKALEINAEVSKEGFMYQGPKPSTKITAIIMLADSSEAACRAIDDISDVKISDTVDKILKSKFEDEQFSECPITIKELDVIKESIISTLIGMYHARIPYPEKDKGKEKNGNN